MAEAKSSRDRNTLLADVAEMYYIDEMSQAEIARVVGVTRSMVSRMLTEAHQKEIIDIRIKRELQADPDLEEELRRRFGLRSAHVVVTRQVDNKRLLGYLGTVAAEVFKQSLKPGITVGLAWGTSISATVDALEMEEPIPVKVVQLIGALDIQFREYDGRAVALRLAKKLGGEGILINAPYICQNAETVLSLMETPGIRETVAMWQLVQVALLGVGSTDPRYSGNYLSGYFQLEDLNLLNAAGAVGNVCGIQFNIKGDETSLEFCQRLVSIRKRELCAIPARIGVAGGTGKVRPILGALRGGFLNILVTDDLTARRVLDLAEVE